MPAIEAHHGKRPSSNKASSGKQGSASGSTPSRISVGFSPGEAEQLVVSTIASAQRSIDVAAYVFTSPAVVDALRRALHRRVAVRVLVDAKENFAGERSKAARAALATLWTAGAKLHSNDHYAIHHNKFIVVDRRHVQTGSFNYTQAAAKRNAENVVVIRNDTRVASKYEREFARLWAQGRGVTAKDLNR